jgi:hypothetical protein
MSKRRRRRRGGKVAGKSKIKRILMGDRDQTLLSCLIVYQDQQKQLAPSDLSIFLLQDLLELFASGPAKITKLINRQLPVK